MPNKEETKERKRMVVEEVGSEESTKSEDKEVEVSPKPEILEEAAKDEVSIESEAELKSEIKNKEEINAK